VAKLEQACDGANCFPAGTPVHMASKSTTLTVTGITWRPEATTLLAETEVYNFEVSNTHTYFVGTENGGVWVHNACCTDIANGLQDAGNPGEVYRLELDPDKVVGPANDLGNGKGWNYHDVLYDPDTNSVRDPMSFGTSDPVPFDRWAREFPYWDVYKWVGVHDQIPKCSC
jgi:hypothetical protein